MQDGVHVGVLETPGPAPRHTPRGVSPLVTHAPSGGGSFGTSAEVARERLGEFVGTPFHYVALDSAVILLHDRHVDGRGCEQHYVGNALVVLVQGPVALIVDKQDAPGLFPKVRNQKLRLNRPVVGDHGKHETLSGPDASVGLAVVACRLQLHTRFREIWLGVGVGTIAKIAFLDQRPDAAPKRSGPVAVLPLRPCGHYAEGQHLAERMSLELFGVTQYRPLVREVDLVKIVSR